jgi:hypothetical protein
MAFLFVNLESNPPSELFKPSLATISIGVTLPLTASFVFGGVSLADGAQLLCSNNK